MNWRPLYNRDLRYQMRRSAMIVTEEETAAARKAKPFEWPSFVLKRASNGWILQEDPDDYRGERLYTISETIDPLLAVVKARVMHLLLQAEERKR